MLRVQRSGRRIRTPHLEARSLASDLPHARVAIVVPKSGHTSAERNRLRRRLREIVRTRLMPLCPRMDVVIRARETAYAVEFTDMARDVAAITRRLHDH